MVRLIDFQHLPPPSALDIVHELVRACILARRRRFAGAEVGRKAAIGQLLATGMPVQDGFAVDGMEVETSDETEAYAQGVIERDGAYAILGRPCRRKSEAWA